MSSLEHGNDRDNCHGDITHEQPIGKQISYKRYKIMASFNGCFYKEDFLDWLLDLDDLFDYENICDERKVELVLYKLREYALRQWERMHLDRLIRGKNKIPSWPRMKKMLAIRFYLLDCDELLSYMKQDYYWQINSHLNYVKEPYIPPLREELHVEKNIFLEKYVEVKEESIEIFQEINEGLVIEEEPEIKIINEIIEDHIIEKDLEVEIVDTIKEEIIEEVVNDLDKVKLDDCNVQAPIILVGDTETKFIDFIEVDRFDSISNSYLVNLYIYMKTNEKEIQVDFFIPLMSCKYGKKNKGLKGQESKYLFILSERFQISKMNSRTSLFQVEGYDARHNLLFKYGNLLILVFN